MAGKLSGSEKSAILLLAMGELPAVEVMKMLDPKDIRQVGQEMGGMASVGSEDHSQVMLDMWGCGHLFSHLDFCSRGKASKA